MLNYLERFSFLADHLLVAIVLAFVFGLICAIILSFRWSSDQTWRLADLVWIFFGGVGVATALITSFIVTERGALVSRLQAAYTEISYLKRAVTEFNFDHCRHFELSRTLIDHFRSNQSRTIICSQTRSMDAALNIYFGVALNEMLSASFESSSYLNTDELLLRANKQFVDARFLGLLDHFSFLHPALEEIAKTGHIRTGQSGAPELFARFFVSSPVVETVARLATSGEDREVLEALRKLEWRIAELDVLFEEAVTASREFEKLHSLGNLRSLSLCLIAFVFPLRIGKSVYELSKA